MAGFVMRNSTITINSTDYQGQLKTAELTPDADSQTYKTLDPNTVLADVDSPTWTFHIAGVQDYTTAVGLARFLTDNHGTVLTVHLEAKTGDVSADFTAIAKAVGFGGDQGSWTEFDVELPVVGVPTFTDPV